MTGVQAVASGYADDTRVLVRYPTTEEQEAGDRADWPWLPGTIVEQCGAGEWEIVVEARELATLEDGSPAPDGTPDDELLYPVCFRDATEIKLVGGAR
jgi:hypothetical protein